MGSACWWKIEWNCSNSRVIKGTEYQRAYRYYWCNGLPNWNRKTNLTDARRLSNLFKGQSRHVAWWYNAVFRRPTVAQGYIIECWTRRTVLPKSANIGISWLPQKKLWAGLISIVMTKNTITKSDVTTTEVLYFISSLPLDVEATAYNLNIIKKNGLSSVSYSSWAFFATYNCFWNAQLPRRFLQGLQTNGALISYGHGAVNGVPSAFARETDCGWTVMCRFTSRDTVLGSFLIRRAISLNDTPLSRHSMISWRSSSVGANPLLSLSLVFSFSFRYGNFPDLMLLFFIFQANRHTSRHWNLLWEFTAVGSNQSGLDNDKRGLYNCECVTRQCLYSTAGSAMHS